MVVQRLVDVERKLKSQAEALAAEKSKEVECLKGELSVLQVGGAWQYSAWLHGNEISQMHPFIYLQL